MAAPTRPSTRKPLGLTSEWNGLPVWAWTGIGAAGLAGLYVFVRGYRKAKAPAATTSSAATAAGLGNMALPGNQLLEPIIINGGAPSQPLPGPGPGGPPSTGGLPPGDDVLANDIAHVNSLYGNILHRSPEPGGFNFWLGRLLYGVPESVVDQAFNTAAQTELRGVGQPTSSQANSAVPVIPAATPSGPTTQPASSITTATSPAPSFSRLAA